ncbi:DNA replication protein PSF2 KNAG_0B05250 [Huiozyma naganishii CBS 8797]|uniref:DNA replication complex GINS protein PSF2 n=1 Tax=Huiozyma naganishii (strain ATCC MYA-139 / BCRC 22969 / CBS 8797 / KCTC 17520 / NBRC 10181 / NCYC 3082 / Yp74L-3) TaxID=1071383 RepID=J7RHF9_HUIN7|nr:hypothetical protein KNAG_0B05250 [Kazachstania naganishii CBS 8797]CCK68958.1 hypothetical protein KNAG_0B05250 [Kazachstania naganishii CBS 8797]
MALPAHLSQTFSPEEIQFLVENEPIKIFPRITTRQQVKRNHGDDRNGFRSTTSWTPHRWRMITTDEAPLNNMVAMQSTNVALWIALLLKQQAKCNIIAPEWLTVKGLDRSIQFEQTYPDRFSPLPWDWLVLSEILFKRASDDFHDPVHELRNRIQDLREMRQVKVLKGLKYLNESHLQLDNLSLLEINELRSFIVNIMNKLRDIHNAFSVDEQGESEDEDISYGTMRDSSTNMS